MHTLLMKRIPLKEARASLVKICSAAVHGRVPIEITRNGSDGAVLISRQDYDELQRDHLRWKAHECREALASGEVPAGTVVVTRDNLDAWRNASDEEWAAGELNA